MNKKMPYYIISMIFLVFILTNLQNYLLGAFSLSSFLLSIIFGILFSSILSQAAKCFIAKNAILKQAIISLFVLLPILFSPLVLIQKLNIYIYEYSGKVLTFNILIYSFYLGYCIISNKNNYKI